MDDKLELIVTTLISQTAARGLNWEPTELGSSIYQLALDNGQIVIRRGYDEVDNDDYYELTIRGSETRPVERVTAHVGEDYGLLGELYDVVDRTVRGVDERLDLIIRELTDPFYDES